MKHTKKVTYKLDIDTGKSEKELKGVEKETKNLGKTTNDTAKDVEKLSESFDEVGGSVGSLGKQITGLFKTLLANPFLAIVAGLSALVTGLYKYSQASVKAAKDTTAVANAMGVTREEANGLRKEINVISAVWDKEYNEVLKSSTVLMKTFGITGTESLELITEGFEKGADVNGEFLELLKEYPAQLRDVGLNAKQSIALLTQTEQMGIFSDKGVDAIKEAGLRLRENTKATADALKVLKKETQQEIKLAIAKGKTFKAIQLVSKGLKDMNLTAQQSQTIVADVFGGPGEDAGLQYLQTIGDINLELDELPSNLSESEIATNNLTESWTRFTDSMVEGGSVLDRTSNFIKNDFSATLERWTTIIDSNASAWEKLYAIIIPSEGALLSYNETINKGIDSYNDILHTWNSSLKTLEAKKQKLKELNRLYDKLTIAVTADGKINEKEQRALDNTLASITQLTSGIKELEVVEKKRAKDKAERDKKIAEAEQKKKDAEAAKTKAEAKDLQQIGFDIKNTKADYEILQQLNKQYVDEVKRDEEKLLKENQDLYDKGIRTYQDYNTQKIGIKADTTSKLKKLDNQYAEQTEAFIKQEYQLELKLADKRKEYGKTTKQEHDQQVKEAQQAYTKRILALTTFLNNSNDATRKSLDEITQMNEDTDKNIIDNAIKNQKELIKNKLDLAVEGSIEYNTLRLQQLKLEFDEEIMNIKKTQAYKQASTEEQEKMRLNIIEKYARKAEKIRIEGDDKAYDVELQMYEAHLETLKEGTEEWYAQKGKILQVQMIKEINAIKATDAWKLMNEEEQQQLLLDIKNKYLKKATDLEKQATQEAVDFSIQATQEVLYGMNDIMSEFADMNAEQNDRIIQGVIDTNDRILNEMEHRYQLEQNLLEQSFNNGELTEREYIKNKLQMENEYLQDKWNAEQQAARQEDEAKRKAFDDQKRYERGAVWMKAASAILGTWAGYSEMGPYGAIIAGIQSAFILATAGMQIKNINSQQYGDGGLLQGPSHANGGIKLNNNEIGEGGEYIINKKSTAKNLELIEAINNNPNSPVSMGIDYNKLGATVAEALNTQKVILTQNDLVEDENDRQLVLSRTTF